MSITRLHANTRRTAAEIRRILCEDWDPMGSATPGDEYDSYVWPLYRLIERGDPAAVRDFLQKAGEELLQCGARDDRLDEIAQRLTALSTTMDKTQ